MQCAFWVEVAGGQVIIHKASGLHEGIDDRSANETEAALAQIFAEGVRFGRGCGELLQSVPLVYEGLASDEPPDVFVECSELALKLEEGARIANGGFDFQPIADDAFVGKQGSNLSLIVLRDLLRIKTVEGATIVVALLEDRIPTEPGLCAFENEELEEDALVV